MKTFRGYVDVAQRGVSREVRKVPFKRVPDGSGQARGDGTKPGWIWGLSMARLMGPKYPDMLSQYPMLQGIVFNLQAHVGNDQLFQVMVNKLEGGAILKAHKDGLPSLDRYHLPIITSNSVTWWDEENGEVQMKSGFWYGPVKYCGVMHSMANYGVNERIHVVVDLVPLEGK